MHSVPVFIVESAPSVALDKMHSLGMLYSDGISIIDCSNSTIHSLWSKTVHEEISLFVRSNNNLVDNFEEYNRIAQEWKLSSFCDHRIDCLSGGTKKRLLISLMAESVCSGDKIVVFDLQRHLDSKVVNLFMKNIVNKKIESIYFVELVTGLLEQKLETYCLKISFEEMLHSLGSHHD